MDNRRPLLPYQPALDGLRGLAVAAVVAYHLGYLAGGFLGVDAFFVLSGYLITSLLLAEHHRNGRIALGEFWSRRARRLLPAAAVMVVVVVVAARALGTAGLRGDVLATLGYAANWHLVFSHQSYFDLFAAPSPLRHTWSLAVEEQFYVIWPLVVAAVLAIPRAGRAVLTTVCIVGIAGSTLAMAALWVASDPSRAYYGTDTRAHLLLVGALLAVVSARSPRGTRARRVLTPIGTMALGGAVLLSVVAHDHDGWLYHGGTLVNGVVVATVIAAVSASPASRLARVLGVAPLRMLGRVSYGVYLWHWPVIVFCTSERAHLTGVTLDLFRLVLVAALTATSYVLVEHPVRVRALRPRAALAGGAAALAAAALVTVAVLPGAATPDVAFVTVAPDVSHLPLAATPTTAAPIVASPITARPRMPRTVLVVGDSVAASLTYGLDSLQQRFGVSVTSDAVFGCGVAAGVVLHDDGTPWSWSPRCAAGIPALHERAIASVDPDLVVWLSTWEVNDRLVGGRRLVFGTPEADVALLHDIDAAARRLTSRGAHLVILAPAPRGPSDRGVVDHPERYAHYAELLHAYAAMHAQSVSVVDLSPLLCPAGTPCPRQLDGMVVRPDGTHFSATSSAWVAARVWPEILAAA